jgi:hypothetical protein
MSNPVFSLVPWRAMTINDVGYKTDVSEGFGGKEWRDSVVSTSRIQISFPLTVIRPTDIDTFVTFMQALKGQFAVCDFVRPARFTGDSPVTYHMRSMMDNVTYDWVKTNYFTAKVQFIEDK